MQFFNIDDSLAFRETNKLAIRLSNKLNDTTRLAYNYWDLGLFYSRYSVKDSAYYNYSNAQKLFESAGKVFYSGRMLMNMAIIQSDLRDYTGSEITTIQAIELLKPLKKYKQLYKCYNNLGVIYNELEEFYKALFYHNKALEYQDLITGTNTNTANSLNNIGVVYENQGKFDQAIPKYNEAIQTENLKQKNTKLYAMLLDNLAYSKFKLKDTVGVTALFQESLHIRDSINDISGKTINKLHLAEFYAAYNDSIRALYLAHEAKELATNSKNYRDVLSAYLLLSKLDKMNSDIYSQQYIPLNNMLLKEERAIRNKFTRIRFETDQFIEENELLTEKNKRYLIIGFITLILGVAIYIITDQRLKNIKLRSEKAQQKANEEIYNLLLTQQNKVDEGKRNEKKRMSEELHDGVLGNLYGIKMNLAVLNPQNSKTAVLKREEYIETLSNVIDEILNVSHELSANAIDADVGYIQLIDDLLRENSSTFGYTYKLESDTTTNWQVIPGEKKMNIYRILQESIQNINKYAKANNVLVAIESDEYFVRLSIRDDGIGYNTQTKKDGIGIKNIKSRIQRLQGSVVFTSKTNKGTSIIIKIPL